VPSANAILGPRVRSPLFRVAISLRRGTAFAAAACDTAPLMAEDVSTEALSPLAPIIAQRRVSELRNHANLIWEIAELLRGDYKQADYGKVILPLVVMRRLSQALEHSKDAVVARAQQLEAAGIENVEPALVQIAGQQFYNRSPLRLPQLLNDAPNVALNLRRYIDGYSSLARAVVENFDFDRQIDKLDGSNLLYQVLARICEVDLHPERVSNLEMGYLFEDLIRRFAEQSNETAGEHFTPREVVRLMVNLLLDGDEEVLRDPGVIRTVYDCACGTGGMLSEAEGHILSLNERARVHLYGQELNPESYAICLADMLVKGQDASHIALGNSLSSDQHAGERFHYCIANPPFGVDWSKVEREVRDEHERLGVNGRFGPGLPRKTDGQLLFLLHLISKMRDPAHGGSRIAIVHNGSPLFTGAAGSGESEIRRYLLENDLLEAIVALPEQLFYNTGIASYVWVLTNRKTPERAGAVQMIDARDLWVRVRRSLGEKRREISQQQIDAITELHGRFTENDRVKVVPNEYFGYRTIVIDRPLRGTWVVNEASWEDVKADKQLARLNPSERATVAAALRGMPARSFCTQSAAAAAIREACAAAGKSVTGPVAKALADRCLRRTDQAPEVRDARGCIIADPELRDTETVPLTVDVHEYLLQEVLPHIPDSWCADADGKVGYEIPFARLFFREPQPRPSDVIKSELRDIELRMRTLLDEVLS
jgi:type I restriction enzyme M protein